MRATIPRTAAVTAVPTAARKTLAVLAFDNNTGNSEYDHVGQGMASMMTTDLATVKELQLLEREKLGE